MPAKKQKMNKMNKMKGEGILDYVKKGYQKAQDLNKYLKEKRFIGSTLEKYPELLSLTSQIPKYGSQITVGLESLKQMGYGSKSKNKQLNNASLNDRDVYNKEIKKQKNKA